jgi:catechol 2,3-dioxygenase
MRSNLPYGIAPPAFRLPDATTLGSVHLQVSDLVRSLAYYQGVLGLRAAQASDGTVVLTPHDDDRPLVVLHTRTGVTRARRGAFGLYHFALLLPDRAALGRLASHVSVQRIQVGMADHLVSEALYLWDPDGLGIEVYADRPRDTWQHRNGELLMATDALDAGSLFAAGRDETWTGLPKKTRLGHVHLHVGDLGDAAAFYHRALGFDKTVWSYPGALFMAAGGYHHHLGTNVWSTGPAPAADHAQLLEWELVVPSPADITSAASSLRGAGYAFEETEDGVRAPDPWGSVVHLRAIDLPATNGSL